MTDETHKLNFQQQKWGRKEVILLVTEYFKTKTMTKIDQENSIENMSKVLRNRAKIMNLKIDERYRNITGIRMKFGNIKSLDPEMIDQGYIGLQNASKLDKEIVNEYLKDPKKIIAEANIVSMKYEG